MKEQFHVTISRGLLPQYPYYPYVIDIYNKYWSGRNAIAGTDRVTPQGDDAKWIDDEASDSNPLHGRGVDIWFVDPDDAWKN